MRKIIFTLTIIIMILFVYGCSSNSLESNQALPTTEIDLENDANPTNTEEKIATKDDFIEADFNKIFNNEWEHMKVKVTGEVWDRTDRGAIIEFILAKTSDGGFGYYKIKTVSYKEGVDITIKEGDIVTIYGVVTVPDEMTGLPMIVANIVEKN